MYFNMRLLIWVCVLCFACSNAGAMFINALTATADGDTHDLLGELGQFLGGDGTGITPKPLSQRKGNNGGTATATSSTEAPLFGFLTAVSTSFQQAANTFGDLMQHISKELRGLFGDSDEEDSISYGTPTTSQRPLHQLHVVSTVLLERTTAKTATAAAATAVPTVPPVPTLPTVPSVPSTPTLPMVAAVPATSTVPIMTTAPTMPTESTVLAVTTVPTVASTPR